MTNTQRGILILIKAALTGKGLELPEDFDIEEAYKEIRRHQIVPIAYTGAVYCGVPKNHPVMQQMFHIYLQQMMHSERQMAAIQRIFKAFDEKGIDYMPLKGTVLKGLYPKPELRLMGDADILIRQEQYPQIEEIMRELDFNFKGANPHEFTWLSKELYLELHTYLFAYILKDYYDYYEDSWHLSKPFGTTGPQTDGSQVPDGGASSNCYTFCSNEDEFIYLFTHYAKHVRTGGIGCRHIIDLWVYRNAYPQMDEAYITDVMSKMNLQDFYATTLNLLEVWFGDSGSKTAEHASNGGHDAQSDQATEFLSEFIFSSGNWGDAKTHALASELMEMQNFGRAHYNAKQSLLRKAFPDINHMSTRYPVLKKHPALLPVFWPVRIASAVLFRRDNVSHIWKANQYATAEKIDDFQEVLETIGLKFDFGKDE